jgi:alpha-ribazole phosphatase
VELAVIRHTRVDNDSGRCYGQSEVALADSFDTELAQLRAQLEDSFCAVYSSPLQRCTRLADHFSAAVQTDPRLLEYNFGDWEMQRWNDIDAPSLDAWMQDFVNVAAPNGENLLHMYARVCEFMQQLREREHERCLLVTHAGVIRCIWAYLLNIPLVQIFKLEVGYGDVLRCRLAGDPQMDVIRGGNPSQH